MNIEEERKAFEALYKPCDRIAFCFGLKKYVQLSREDNDSEIVDHANDSLRIWQAAKAQAVPECTWSQDSDEDMYGTWHTKCGNAFALNEDGPTENQMNYCCYCGGKLIEAREQSLESKYPHIYRAAKEIWYDNGMINQFEPIEEKIEQLSVWLKSLDENDLEYYNEKLNLTDDDLSEVCCGEETLAYSILSDETVHEFLGCIFDEDYAPEAQEPAND